MSFRPKTLVAAVVPVLVSTSLVYSRSDEYPLFWVFAFSLLGALFIQIATNLFNDAIDFEKGADTKERIGPLRVTQSGLISKSKVYVAAFVFCLLAVLCGVPLVWHGGIPIVIVGIVSLLLAYSYTGGPFPLAYLGLGELFVLLFFGLVAVGCTSYLHVGYLTMDDIMAGLQVGLLATVLIAINNFRDVDQDLKAHKKTLAVRFGKNFAKNQISIFILLPFILSFWWFYKGQYLAFALPMVTFPFAFKLVKNVFKSEPSKVLNNLLAKAALLHVAYGLLLSVGFWLSRK